MATMRTNKSPKTLQEAYKLRLLKEKVQRLDERLIAENAAILLIEELSKNDFKNATEMLKKMNDIAKASSSVKVLVGGLKKSAEELNNFIGEGGSILGALKKAAVGNIAGLVKKMTGVDFNKNPLVKCASLISSLESGFGDLEGIIKNNIDGYDFKTSVAEAADERSLKIIKKTIVKSLAEPPEGKMASIGRALGLTGAKLPYDIDLNKMADQIVASSGPELQKLITTITSTPIADKLAQTSQNISQAASNGSEGAVPEKASTPQPVTSVEDIARAAAAGESAEKGKDAGPAVAAAAENPKNFTQKLVGYIAKNASVEVPVVNKVVSALVKAGKLKTTYELATESKNRNIAVLTERDARKALELYMECGGSTSRWVDLLAEEALPADLKKDIEEFPKRHEGSLGDDAKKFTSTLKGVVEDLEQDSFVGDNEIKELDDILKKSGIEDDKVIDALKKFRDDSDVQKKLKANTKDTDKQSVLKKYEKIISAIKDSIKDVEPAQIAAVLDALPDYFVVERKQRRKILEAKRIVAV